MKILRSVLITGILLVSANCIVYADPNDYEDTYDLFQGIHTKHINLYWTFGTMDFSMNGYEKISFDFGANILYLVFEGQQTGLGVEVDPFRYWYNGITKDHILTFGGFTMYWNLLKIAKSSEKDRQIFGPFMKVNFLNLFNFEEFTRDEPIYTVGIRFSMHMYCFRLFGIETGYRNINGRHSVYLGLQLILPPGFLLLMIQ
ncbi:MAG: hypothetical protein LBJ31_02660 [Treponema sp.]|jgi:hypothetical protein|nr:hypothetical protein [Treponema sp.]